MAFDERENMSERQMKGMEIAARCSIERKGHVWQVPSQSKGGRYAVRVSGKVGICNCPDFDLRGQSCKHIFAVQFVIEREKNADGSTTVTKTMRTMETVTVRQTYPQNWAAYNRAQTGEKDTFQVMLHDLCRGITEPDTQTNGRPRLPLADVVFATAFKVYSTVSGRRFMSDLRESHSRGHISRVPHYNSIFNYLENPDLTPLLRDLITETSLPLKSVEVDFAVDSSGFTTSRFTPWFDHKYGVTKREHDWVKCHIMCGVKTNIITAVEIHGRDASDTKLLPEMVQDTARNFTVSEVSADKGYGSISNTDAIEAVGATPFIALKNNHSGRRGGTWGKMFHYFMYKREDFLSHYHKRSNVESTFSMMKRKFGDFLRSKTDVAMINETLCKVLCHNIVVLIHEMHELGIEPTFWSDSLEGRS